MNRGWFIFSKGILFYFTHQRFYNQPPLLVFYTPYKACICGVLCEFGRVLWEHHEYLFSQRPPFRPGHFTAVAASCPGGTCTEWRQGRLTQRPRILQDGNPAVDGPPSRALSRLGGASLGLGIKALLLGKPAPSALTLWSQEISGLGKAHRAACTWKTQVSLPISTNPQLSTHLFSVTAGLHSFVNSGISVWVQPSMNSSCTGFLFHGPERLV